jgi:hypothetical protein
VIHDKALYQFRRDFCDCVDCAQKQMGLRYIRNALNLGTRNEARVAELVGRLPMLLASAREITALRAGGV